MRVCVCVCVCVDCRGTVTKTFKYVRAWNHLCALLLPGTQMIDLCEALAEYAIKLYKSCWKPVYPCMSNGNDIMQALYVMIILFQTSMIY